MTQPEAKQGLRTDKGMKGIGPKRQSPRTIEWAMEGKRSTTGVEPRAGGGCNVARREALETYLLSRRRAPLSRGGIK